MMKRVFDIAVAAFMVVLTTPLMLVIPLLIRIDSNGPVIYKSRRIGRDEKEISLFKFRTMIPNHDQNRITVGEDDPRITRVGRLLRQYKLDELPQLFNVIRGDLSLVGPRPDVPGYNEFYKKYDPGHYKMKPGLTSPASIYFIRENEIYRDVQDPREEYIRNTIPRKVELDRDLADNDILDDLKVLVRTLKHMIWR